MIEEYTPIRLDTEDPDFTDDLDFEDGPAGVRTFSPMLTSSGGMSAKLIETESSEAYAFSGNYVAVLAGSCTIDVGATASIPAPDAAVVQVMPRRRQWELPVKR